MTPVDLRTPKNTGGKSMWIKKENIMFNLNHYDAVLQDSFRPEILFLYANDRKTPVAIFDAEQVRRIIEEIAEAMKNGESVYVLPCENHLLKKNSQRQ